MDKPADPATPFGEVYQSFLGRPGTGGQEGHDDRALPLGPVAGHLVGFAATIPGGIDVADREHPMAFG